MSEIINRVAKSSLITIDLEDFYPNEKRINIDLSDWLFKGLILKEKEYRANLKSHDWTQYKDALVSLNCSTDAILPAWTYLLINSYLQAHAKMIVIGTQKDLDEHFYSKLISELDISEYKDQRIILKGCSRKPVPENAYILLANKLLPHVKSLMFGEACSTVPLYKKT